MAITQAELLELFSQVGSIKNSDQFMIITANQNGTVSTTKITAELVRAYLNEGFTITVGDDGYLYIGGVRTDIDMNPDVITNAEMDMVLSESSD